MLKTPLNPAGLSINVFDTLRRNAMADRSQLYKDLASGPFFGANRPGAKVSHGMMDSFWRQGMQAGHKNTFDCIKAFSETDFTEDLKKVRCADFDSSWQRRPDRADWCGRAWLIQAGQKRQADGLRRRAAWIDGYTQRAAQC
jgi:hypothetical protein